MAFEMEIAPYMKNRTKDKPCKTCTGTVRYPVIAGRKTTFACRKYDQEEIRQELMIATMEMDIFAMGLIEEKEIGIDGRAFEYTKGFKVKVESLGTGSYGKKMCARDYGEITYATHKKVGNVHLLHIDHKICPFNFIGLETLQDMIFPSGEFADATNPKNEYTDTLILAGRAQTTEDIQITDIIGIFKGTDENSAHYDGILAHMFWGYQNAYFHSIQYDLSDESGISYIPDDNYLSVKVGGRVFTVKYTPDTGTNEALSEYGTLEEIAEAIVNWINQSLQNAGGFKMYNAVYLNDCIIITHRRAGKKIDMEFAYSPDGAIKDWWQCNTVLYHKIVQNFMAIDERPWLTKWRSDAYNIKNIERDLPLDIFALYKKMPNPRSGAEYALFIDKYLYEMYVDNLGNEPHTSGINKLVTKFGDRIYHPDALSRESGTGIWFIAPVSNVPSLRNVYHFYNSSDRSMISAWVDEDCDEMKFKFRTLHGVMIKDLRFMGGNLLCSPWASNLIEPQPECAMMLPCHHKSCKDGVIQENECDKNCNIHAGFTMSDVTLNKNYYGINGNIFEVQYDPITEEPLPLPAGAEPVYMVQILNNSSGVPINLIGSEEYEYTLITSDGGEYTSNEEDPIFTFVGNIEVTFTVQQKVSVTTTDGKTCDSTYTASRDDDGEFEMVGNCSDIDFKFAYRIDKNVTSSIEMSGVTGVGAELNTSVGIIPISENVSKKVVAEEIQAYMADNNYVGNAKETANGFEIVTQDFTVTDFKTETSGTPITPTVNTTYEATLDNQTIVNDPVFDGINEVVLLIESDEPTSDVFNELPENELLSTTTATPTFTLTLSVETASGCQELNMTDTQAFTGSEPFINGLLMP